MDKFPKEYILLYFILTEILFFLNTNVGCEETR